MRAGRRATLLFDHAFPVENVANVATTNAPVPIKSVIKCVRVAAVMVNPMRLRETMESADIPSPFPMAAMRDGDDDEAEAEWVMEEEVDAWRRVGIGDAWRVRIEVEMRDENNGSARQKDDFSA